MRNLLIVCDAFPPAFAPRMGALSKYLHGLGWSVYVLTEEQDDAGFSLDSCTPNILRLRYYKNSNKLAWLGGFILDYGLNYKSTRLVSLFKKHWSGVNFDIVLCSTYLIFPMHAAYQISKICNIPLVYDFRDIIEQFVGFEFAKHRLFRNNTLNNFIHKIRRKKIIGSRNRLMVHADAVTTVSPWHKIHLEQILSSNNAKCRSVNVIYNGYDPQLFSKKSVRADKFIIEYTGRILDLRLQNPLLLFEALQKMKSQRLISPSDFCVRWHTDALSARKILRLASDFGVGEFIKIYGFVPQKQVSDLLNESSIILVLTNKMEQGGPRGVLTTKFFEALAVKKPILCVRSDESYLKQLIVDTNSGLAASSSDEVVAFIKKYYDIWKSDGIVNINTEDEVLRPFSRESQATQFDRLLKTLIK